jgi:hypothetical protein
LHCRQVRLRAGPRDCFSQNENFPFAHHGQAYIARSLKKTAGLVVVILPACRTQPIRQTH